MALTRATATVELSNGDILTVRIINADLLRYEETAARHGWPTMTVKDGVASMNGMRLQQTFQAWAALRREDLYSGKWEEFKDSDCIDLEYDEEQVDPFVPDPALD